MNMNKMDLGELIAMSRKYGSDPDYVLAGGGNTSCKEDGVMAIKASGVALSSIGEDGFVMMDVEKLRELTQAVYPDDDKAREACALKAMMEACIEKLDEKRPSVECILHALFEKAYVLHVHPALVNGLTCGQDGAAAAAELFSDMKDTFLWLPLIKPGFTLSKVCADLFTEQTSVILIQNHGIFIASDTTAEAERMLAEIVSKISERIVRYPELGALPLPQDAEDLAIKLEGLYRGKAVFLLNNEVARLTACRDAYKIVMKPFSPDHIVYCGAYPLFVDKADELEEAFKEYEETYGTKPKIVAVRGLGVFALGADEAEAERTAALYIDAVKISVYCQSFGGPLALPGEYVDFIVNWESESYRQKKK